MDKTTKWILIAGGILVLILLFSRSQASTVRTTQLSGTGGVLSGLGNLFAGGASAIKSIWGNSPSAQGGEYTPDIATGNDVSLGGTN